MPIIKSAKKRVRVAKQASIRNMRTKRALRGAVKSFQGSLEKGGAKAADAHRQAQSAVAKAGKKNVMHKNKVARKQRQLAAQAKAAGVKLTGSKTAAKTAAKSATKSTAKPAAKTAAKKTTKKTTAAKKAAPKK